MKTTKEMIRRFFTRKSKTNNARTHWLWLHILTTTNTQRIYTK